jgi:hypothetical protein
MESVSAVTATNSVDLGTRTTFNGDDYIYVHNAGAAQISQGMPAMINSFSSGYSVSVSNAASQAGFFVGHCQHATIPTANYGWLMTRGLANIIPDGTGTSIATGTEIVPGIDGGYVAVGTAYTTCTGIRVGFTLSGVVTAYTTTNKAFIKSPYFS